VSRLARRVSLVEQELPTLLDHLSSPQVFSGVRVTRSLVFCVYRCSSFCPFSSGHCVVSSSSIYGFWLPLWYLQTLLVLLSFFFWSLCCLFFFDIRILITPLVSSNSSCPLFFFFWSLCCLFFFDIRILITPLVSSYSHYITNKRYQGYRFHKSLKVFTDFYYHDKDIVHRYNTGNRHLIRKGYF
jgi:hypothetical protein